MTIVDDCYWHLIQAIAVQAADDLRKCYTHGGRCKDGYSGGVMYASDIEKYFLSDSFFSVYGIDGKWLIDKLRKEAGYEQKEHNPRRI